MDNVSIPISLFDDPTFNKLYPGDMKFLLCLYAEFHDTEQFTINLETPEVYRQSAGVYLANRIGRLCKAGFLEVVGKQRKMKSVYHGNVRIFSLKYK